MKGKTFSLIRIGFLLGLVCVGFVFFFVCFFFFFFFFFLGVLLGLLFFFVAFGCLFVTSPPFFRQGKKPLPAALTLFSQDRSFPTSAISHNL